MPMLREDQEKRIGRRLVPLLIAGLARFVLAARARKPAGAEAALNPRRNSVRLTQSGYALAGAPLWRVLCSG